MTTVKPGDSLWKIAARELNDSSRWREIAQLNRLTSPYLLYVGQDLLLPPKQSVRVPSEYLAADPVCRVPKPTENIGPATDSLKRILDAVDGDVDLRGAGVVLKLPTGEYFQLRSSRHTSGLETIVVAEITMPQPADERSWWERWNGVVLNCGGAALSWGAIGLATAAEVPSLGSSTPLVVLGYASATATTAQCTLAVAKETSSDFREFVESEDGYVIDAADVALDIISLAGGVAGAINAVRSSNQLLNASKYAKYLSTERKGKLLKALLRIEQQEKDLVYFRRALERLKEAGKILDPAGRGISNNLLSRSLPYITKSLQRETISQIASAVSSAASVVSSYYGGVGSRGYGTVKVVVKFLQEKILQ